MVQKRKATVDPSSATQSKRHKVDIEKSDEAPNNALPAKSGEPEQKKGRRGRKPKVSNQTTVSNANPPHTASSSVPYGAANTVAAIGSSVNGAVQPTASAPPTAQTSAAQTSTPHPPSSPVPNGAANVAAAVGDSVNGPVQSHPSASTVAQAGTPPIPAGSGAQSSSVSPSQLSAPNLAAQAPQALNAHGQDDPPPTSVFRHPPQRVLPDNAPCPIDWALPGLQGIDPANKDVYIMRSPWKSRSDYTMDAIKARLDATYNVKIHQETWRKRFTVANAQVFKVTGMWWEQFPFGLKKLIPELESKKAYEPKGNKTGNAKPTANSTSTKAPIVKGRVFTIHASEPEGDDEFARRTTVEAAYEVSPLFRQRIDDGIYEYTDGLETTPRTLDILLSCFAPEMTGNLPTDIYRLVNESGRNHRFVQDNATINMHDLIDLYLLATQLECHRVCNIVANSWRKLLLEEVVRGEEYRTGVRPLSERSDLPAVLDFQPAYMNKLFTNPTVRQHYPGVLKLWKRILAAKGPMASAKVMEEWDGYCEAFLAMWTPVVTPKRGSEEVNDGDTNSVAMASDEESSEDMSAGQDEQSTKDGKQSNGDQMDIDSGYGAGANGSTAPLDCSASPEETKEPVKAGPSSTQRAEHRGSILTWNEEYFCRKYHYHGMQQHGNCTTPFSETELAALQLSSRRRKRPAHHVSMVINGVRGYSIANHTSLSKTEFRRLPDVYPYWDWDKTRAVHDYYLSPNDRPELYDKHPLIFPVPVYFDGTLEYADIAENIPVKGKKAVQKGKRHAWQDEFGRWPNHPGYKDPTWTPDATVGDDRASEYVTEPYPSEHDPNSEEEEEDGSPQVTELGGEKPVDDEMATRTAHPGSPNVPHPTSWWGLKFDDQGWLTRDPLDRV